MVKAREKRGADTGQITGRAAPNQPKTFCSIPVIPIPVRDKRLSGVQSLFGDKNTQITVLLIREVYTADLRKDTRFIWEWHLRYIVGRQA